MVDGLFFCATVTGRRGGHTPFVQTGAETPDTGVEAVKPDPGSSWEGHSRWVGAGNENAESCGVIRPLRVPLVIRPLRRTYVVVVSVARWLSHKTAKWCHKKLLDPAKNLVTNFQQKSAESSEILPKNLLLLRWLKSTSKVTCQVFVFCLTFAITGQGWKCSSWPPRVSAHNFFRRHFEQHKCNLPYLLFLAISFKWPHVFIHSRAVLSNKQTEHSFNLWKLSKCGVVIQNFVLFTFGSTQKVLWPCLGAFCYQHAIKVHMFRYDLYSIVANFVTGFSWISRIGTEPNFKYWILQPHLSVKNFGNVALVHQRVFLSGIITEPSGNIIYVVQ